MLEDKDGGVDRGSAGKWGALYTQCFQEDLLGLGLGSLEGGRQETEVKHFSLGSL